jgi:hypothetical protein
VRRVRVCLQPDRISHPKRSDRSSSHTGPRIRMVATIGSPKLPGLSLRTWPSILSSLVMSSRKKHVSKDYSAVQTKGSIICNLKKFAYLTASRLSSSTSNPSDQPRPQGVKNSVQFFTNRQVTPNYMADHIQDAGGVEARDGTPAARRRARVLDAYLSPVHRDARSSGRPMAALGATRPACPGNLRSPTS